MGEVLFSKGVKGKGGGRLKEIEKKERGGKEKNVQGSIAFSSAEVNVGLALAQEVSHMRSRRQANLAK